MRRVLTGVMGLLVAVHAGAQGAKTQAEMHARVVGLYSFSPHTLTDAQRGAKSAEMDRFWADVTRDPSAQLPLLRVELRREDDPAFFLSDGSSLLLSLSKDAGDKALAAEAVAHCDLADVKPAAYFQQVHALSMDGVDTTRAALHILDDARFRVPVPQHAITLDQGQSLVYLLVPVKESLWMAAARERFGAVKDDGARLSLMMLFFYSQTKSGDDALRAAAADAALSAPVRQAAKQYLETEKQTKAMQAVPVQGNESAVREARRKRLGAVSDEAVDDMQMMTARLVQLRTAN